jgi:hypothetical protein
LVTQTNLDLANDLLLRWVVLTHQPLSCVEHSSFQALIHLINAPLSEYLYKSGNSTKELLLREFDKRKERVKLELQKAKSVIHISFDLWTSSNSLAMLGIVAHYLGSSLTARSLLIGLRQLKGVHSGENQASVIVSVLKEFEISDRIGHFISDNVTSNDHTVRVTCEVLGLPNWKQRRLRCIGHIINLVAKQFLFGRDEGSYDFEIDPTARMRLDVRQALEILRFWRKKGPIGKLHNLIIWIQGSTQRIEAFKKITTDHPEERDSELSFSRRKPPRTDYGRSLSNHRHCYPMELVVSLDSARPTTQVSYTITYHRIRSRT